MTVYTQLEDNLEKLKLTAIKEYLQPYNPILLNSLVDHDLTRKVSNESMIIYLGNKYSVPVKYIGQTVNVKASGQKIMIYHASRLVRQHSLSDKKLNYHRDDMKEILGTTIFHDLNDDDLANQVEINLRMFDQL